MEQQTYEREIDLIQLIKSMLKKLWIMILAGIVGAVLLGAFKLIPMVRDLNNPEILEEQEEAYQNRLEAYEKSSEQAEKEIENLNTSIERQEEYNEQSVLMQMNPFDVQVGTVQYYIDTNYQINPEYVYQNPDITKSVLNAYASIAQNGTMYNYLREHMEDELDPRYLNELVTVSVDYNNYMINIRVQHKSSKECDELLKLVGNCFDDCRERISANIGSHDMQVVTESSYATVDLNLETTQKNNQSKVEDWMEALEKKQEELSKMEAPEKNVSTVLGVVKSGVKYILVGGMLGGFLAAAVIFFMILIDTTIKDEKDVAFYLGLPVLAEVPSIQGEERTVKAGRKNKKERLNQYKSV